MKQDYPDYRCRQKRVKINNSYYTAFFPEKHSGGIEGIISHCEDMNKGYLGQI